MHELEARDGAALAYDAKGNLTADARGAPYHWDGENRLRAVYGAGAENLDAGLVAHLSLDSAVHGTTPDRTASGHEGTLVGNSLVSVDGARDGALILDGDGDAVLVEDAPDLRGPWGDRVRPSGKERRRCYAARHARA